MPCALAERDVLQQLAVAPNQQMRRDSALPDVDKKGVNVRIESVVKKIVNPGPAELFWWKADIMDNQQIDCAVRRPVILIGRAALTGFGQQDAADPGVHCRRRPFNVISV